MDILISYQIDLIIFINVVASVWEDILRHTIFNINTRYLLSINEQRNSNTSNQNL